jgi:hypothetical protein
VTGCTKYADIEQVQMGMPLDELLQLETPCYYRGTSGDQLKYSCKFSVPYESAFSKRAVRPYVLMFKEGKLTEMELDERELDRQSIRSQSHYKYGYYGRYRY